MRFLRTLDDGRFAVALEILPPQKALPRVLLRRARLLGGAPQAINVIQRPGRQSSLDASIALHQAGIEPAWHLVTRGRSRAEIEGDLRAAATAGIDQVLCILGDHAGTAGPDGPTIREAIAMTRARIPGAFIGATLNQYGRDPEAVIRNLVPKLRRGRATSRRSLFSNFRRWRGTRPPSPGKRRKPASSPWLCRSFPKKLRSESRNGWGCASRTHCASCLRQVMPPWPGTLSVRHSNSLSPRRSSLEWRL
ncbi:MAG: methylenetetrahydrofolate reductase [Dehalococcoidia bacterium]|nr:methylenetetrahydrofolate reductase [Dehalococcoidia bacterium]